MAGKKARKKKKFRGKYLYFLAGIVLIAFFFLVLATDDEDRVCFDRNCFYVEVVDTPETRAQGLMFREYLPADEGMLFIFEEELIYSFWMKNTLIPLDMIWINSDFEVVHIYENAEPCEEDPCPSIDPGVPALYVLEVNAGKAREIGLSVGDRAEFIVS